MRLMLHTLGKDARRLWPAVLTACFMLAMLARADRWRYDWLASPLEGWMTMLLTMAWACVAALAVLEEPLVGDRNFWTTRPHRWPGLLAAKLLFVVLAIHLPSLLADAYILGMHGFSPLGSLPELLSQQALFFASVTLPAMAVASLVRSFTHFVIAAFLVATGLLFLAGGFQALPVFAPLRNELHHALERAVLALAAIAILWMQYAQRRIVPGRVVAIAAALAAASLAAWLPARAEYAVSPVPQSPRISLRDAALSAGAAQRAGEQSTTVILPIAIDLGAQSAHYRLPLIDLVVTTPDGTRIQSLRNSPDHPYQKIDLSVYAPLNLNSPWLSLRFSRSAWDRVKNAPVHISGDAAFEFYRSGQTYSLPVRGDVAIPGLGRCHSYTTEENFTDGALKVECESPREVPAGSIRVLNEWFSPFFSQRLTVPNSYMPGPHDTWLSPLHRSQALFRVADTVTLAPGENRWRIPVEWLPATRLGITPEISAGHALSHFEFDDVPLARWLANQVPSSPNLPESAPVRNGKVR